MRNLTYVLTDFYVNKHNRQITPISQISNVGGIRYVTYGETGKQIYDEDTEYVYRKNYVYTLFSL